MSFLGLTDLTGLNLTQIEALPHYSRFLRKMPHLEGICRAYESERHTHVLRLDDNDGVLLDGDGKLLFRIEGHSGGSDEKVVQ